MIGQLSALGDPRETRAFTPSLLLYPRYHVLLPELMRSEAAPGELSRHSASFSSVGE